MPWQTIGHEPAQTVFEQAIRAGRVSHAYLVVGPANVGKTTLAYDFARALVCTGETPPCDTCQQCRMLRAGLHPDVIQIEAKDDEPTDYSALWLKEVKERQPRTLRIEQARQLVGACALRPNAAAYRIATLDGSQVQGAAASALLKLFEEPSGSMVLILRAAAEEAVPAPIVSRCQVVRLRPVARQRIAAWLTSTLPLAPGEAACLAAICDGRPGLARRLAELPGAVEALHKQATVLLDLLDSDTVSRLEQAGTWVGSGLFERTNPRARAAIDLATLVWHDLLRAASRGDEQDIALSRLGDRLVAVAEREGFGRLARQLRAIERASRLLDANVQPRLLVEWLLLQLGRPAMAAA